MKKIYFGKKKKSEPRLALIVGVVALLFILILVGPYLYARSRSVLPALGAASKHSMDQQLQEANEYFNSTAYDEAEKILKPLLNGRDAVFTPRAILLQAAIENKRDNQESALELLSKACETFAGSPEFPALNVEKGRQYERMGQQDEAQQIYESVRDNAAPEQQAAATAGLGRLAEKSGNKQEARDLYRDALPRLSIGTAQWDEVADDLGRLNVELIFSPQETSDSRFYSVEKGDSLISIGIKLNTTQGLLMTANNITDPSKLHLGQRLKYTPKDFYIIIERSTCNLYLFDSHGFFKRYKVGLGKPGHETTLGSYVIGNKQKDPVWFKPGAGAIDAGSEDNELGTRWMPLVPTKEGLPTDLGIHGTVAPETVGFYSSKGCARMENEKVEELFDLVVRSTPVDIVESLADRDKDVQEEAHPLPAAEAVPVLSEESAAAPEPLEPIDPPADL